MRSEQVAGAGDGLIRRIAEAQRHPPVGLILISWELGQGPGPAPGPSAEPDPIAAQLESHVQQSVAFVVAACTDESDEVAASGPRMLAVIRRAMTGPAAAEGLALRLNQRIEIELARLATSQEADLARWAIGVANGRPADTAAELFSRAERALQDSWATGGRHPIAFDDTGRSHSHADHPAEPADHPTNPTNHPDSPTDHGHTGRAAGGSGD